MLAGSRPAPLFSRVLELLDRREPVYLFVCAVGGARRAGARLPARSRRSPARRQLRWIAWGTALGVGPFAFGYALPWALGIDPPLALQLTAIPLGLVPLTFASAIVRYRLRDVEVIVKRGARLYRVRGGERGALRRAAPARPALPFASDADRRNWIIALLATLVIVLLAQPVKEAVQNALDRVFYRDRYDYRRALVGVRARSEQRPRHRPPQPAAGVAHRRDAGRRSDGADARPDDGDRGRLRLDRRLRIRAAGAARCRARRRCMTRLDGGHTSRSTTRSPARASPPEEVEFWRDAGIYYFVPCVSRGARSRCSRSAARKPTSRSTARISALLTAVAGQVATAIENGRLYRQLHLKAEELGRMREFNENILESLDDGLVVVRRRGADRPLEPRARGLLRVSREAGDRPAARRRLRPAVRRGAASRAARASLRRDAVPGAAAPRARTTTPRLLVNATVVPLQNSAGATTRWSARCC